MKICAAQVRSLKGDVAQNTLHHIDCVCRAIEHRAELIVFPELSITGYEPGLAEQLAAGINEPKLDLLQELSDKHHITICAGMPVKAEQGIQIGMFIFQPSQPRLLYSKQHLHTDELPFFVSGNTPLTMSIAGHTIAPAICYESLLHEHAAEAAGNKAGIYLASVAKPANGVEKAYAHYPFIAKKHAMVVVMANAVGPSDNFTSAGCSAAWNKQGELLSRLDETNEGLLIVDTGTDEITRLPV